MPKRRDEFDDLNEDQRPEPFSIEKTLDILTNGSESGVLLPAGAVYGLSDLSGDALKAFKGAWPGIEVERRRRIVDFLSEVGEYNFDLNFEPLAYLLFEDDDAQVRAAAIDLTWFVSSETLFHTLVRLVSDPAFEVRAAAISALGRFIYEAELEEFDATLGKKAQKLALAHYDDLNEDLEVRRRSLEAIAYCGHARVVEMIEEAYEHIDPLMRASAIFAMGASLDRRWAETVEAELYSPLPELRFEAARAAGELNLTQAVPHLVAMAQEDDYEIKTMCIWALGEIGSPEARRGLQELLEQAEDLEDEVLIEAIEEATEVAQLVGGGLLPMFNFADFEDNFENDGLYDEFEDEDEDDDYNASDDDYDDDRSSMN